MALQPIEQGDVDQVDVLGGHYPDLISVDPSSGSAGTGTQVTINGSGVRRYSRLGACGLLLPKRRGGDARTGGFVERHRDPCIVPTASMSGYPGSAGSGPVTVTNTSGLTSSGYDFHVTFGYGGTLVHPGCSYLVNPNTSDTPSEETMVDAGALAWNPPPTSSSWTPVLPLDRVRTSNDRNEIFWTTSLASGILAQAWYWFSGSTIFENDIGFNDNYAWGDGSGVPSTSRVSLRMSSATG